MAEPAALTPCCTHLEHYPRWVAELARATAPTIGPVLGALRPRPGTLAQYPEAQARLMARAQPLDLLLTSNKNRVSGRIIPGRFTHVAVYLGDEAHLRRLGLWTDPLVTPHHAALRAGRLFIESEFDGTTLLSPPDMFDTDLVALIRPTGLTRARQRRATRLLFSRLGSPFNFRFDLAACDCTFCTQLVDQAMPWLDLPRRRIYDTETILPDDIAVATLERRHMALVGYLRGTRSGWQAGGRDAVIRDMNAYWARHGDRDDGPAEMPPTGPAGTPADPAPSCSGSPLSAADPFPAAAPAG